MPDLEPREDGVQRRTRAYLAHMHRQTPPPDLEDRVARAVIASGRGRRVAAAVGTVGLVAVCAAIAVVALAVHGGGQGGGVAPGTGSSAPPAAPTSPCVDRSFQLSLAKDTGGQSSPTAAAEWFAVHGGVWSDIPTTGWRVVPGETSGTFVQSGSILLQTLQGSDGTWQVASGTDLTCKGSTPTEGLVTGTLQGVGGPALQGVGPTPRPMPGTVTLRETDGATFTTSAGGDGAFSIEVPSGTYTVTGRSPLYQSGTVDCDGARRSWPGSLVEIDQVSAGEE